MIRWPAAVLLLVLAGGGLAVVLHRAAAPGRDATRSSPAVAALASETRVTRADFVGAAACGECHASQLEAWSRSTHGLAGGAPGPETVIAPFDGTPIRFRDAVVTPEVTADGEYAFRVEGEGRAPKVYRVDGVVGRGHMVGGGTQGFLSELADGTMRFLPFDFSRHAGVWFCNTTAVSGGWTSTSELADLRPDEGWVPITPEMRLTACGDWPPVRVFGSDERLPSCQSCHGSQVRLAWDTATTRYRTEIESLSVNCESCHGPGRAHVELARSGQAGRVVDLRIAVLDTLSKDASLEVCFQCHALKHVLDPDYLPGEDPSTHYSLLLPLVGSRPLHPDGRVRTFGYQQGHLASACYLSGSMTCVSCHAPHGLDYRTVSFEPLEGRFDDGQCLGCHASKAPDLELHTRHARGSEGSRCVACHMPYLQQPMLGDRIPYGRSDHTISVPRPAEDAALGIVNACSSCHDDLGVAELEAVTRRWWGELKPRNPAVAALLDALAGSASGERVLVPEARHPLAQVMAMDHLLQEVLRPDMEDPPPDVVRGLIALAGDPDVDVRSVALAALHLTASREPGVRSLLDAALQRADTTLVRPRWVMALGLTAETYRDRGDPNRAVLAYEKALEVEPTDVPTLLGLGVTFSIMGDDSSAVRFYRRVLEVEPREPIGWTNLGLSLENLGDAGPAEEAYRRALELDPRLGLARMNLGNLHLRDGQDSAAIEEYRRAVEAEPWLSRAWFYMGVAYAREGELAPALEALRRALEFAPEDEEILGVFLSLGGEPPA
jgi:Flp pilus assembly protein TadD